MNYDDAINRAADHVGPRNAETADKIARALQGEVGHVPTIALDFIWRARRIHRRAMPASRAAVLKIIQEDKP